MTVALQSNHATAACWDYKQQAQEANLIAWITAWLAVSALACISSVLHLQPLLD
jgi:hypothetical protein